MKKLLVLLAAIAATALASLSLATAAGAQDGARIHLIHGIPGVDVDVVVDGSPVIEGFAYGDTQDLSSFAGETLAGLQVVVAGTEDVAIDAGDTALPASGNYTIVAHLDADGVPALAVFENDTSAIAAGEGRLVVRHAAAAPAVDILAGDSPVFENVVNGAGGSIDLAVGTVTASVVPTGATEPVVIGPADLPITDGTSLIVYAVGSLDDGSLGVLTESIDGLGSAPTSIPTGTAPVETDGTSPLVWIAAAIGGAALIVGGSRVAATVGVRR